MEPVKASARQAVEEILTDRKLSKQYWKNPEAALQKSKVLAELSGQDREHAKEIVKEGIAAAEKAHSLLTREEEKQSLMSAIDSAESSYSKIIWMNVILFAVGIIFFVVAASVGLALQKDVFVYVFGIGGLATAFTLFFVNPIQRIQNAASNHARLRAVIFAYRIQLANLRLDVLPDSSFRNLDAVKGINEEIRAAMEHAVKTIQEYNEVEIKKPEGLGNTHGGTGEEHPGAGDGGF